MADCLILHMVFIYFCLQIVSYDYNIIINIKKYLATYTTLIENFLCIGKIVNRNIL